MNCVNNKQCKNVNLDIKQILICDKCSKGHCKGCSKIAPTEIKCLELKKERRLRYYCPDCLNSITENENILKINQQLIEENTALKNKLEDTTSSDSTGILNDFQMALNELKAILMQAINETNTNIAIQQDKYQKETILLRNEIKVIRDSNIDMVRLLTQVEKQKVPIPINSVKTLESNPIPHKAALTLPTSSSNIQKSPNMNTHSNTKSPMNISTPSPAAKNRNTAKSLTNLKTSGKSNSRVTNNLHTEENAIPQTIESENTNSTYTGKNEGSREIRRRRKQPKVGNGEGDINFHGREDKTEKKIWLYVSKVPDSITENNIKQYIEKRTDTQNVYVKKLEMFNTRIDNQSFMIGVDPQLIRQVYEPSFWPRKVTFNRFDFRLGKRFLDQTHRKQMEPQEASTHPQSFL